MPDWEDFKNMYGGRWVLEWRECDLKNYDDLDTFWLETLFILIGAHGEPYHDIVNGAVINVRKQRYRIAVWLKVGIVYFTSHPVPWLQFFTLALIVYDVPFGFFLFREFHNDTIRSLPIATRRASDTSVIC